MARGLFADLGYELGRCFHDSRGQNKPLTSTFASWAVTGSNRRPLRCKRSALPLS